MEISLTQGQIALIDDEDYELVSQYKWCVHKEFNIFYAITAIRLDNGRQKIVRLHRLIMGAKKGQQIDHRNRNGLDNRKENLRFCSHTQNQQNKIGWGSSSYKGVSWHKGAKKWAAYIRLNKKLKHLGLFKNEIEAAKIYDTAAKELFGEFAKLNFGG